MVSHSADGPTDLVEIWRDQNALKFPPPLTALFPAVSGAISTRWRLRTPTSTAAPQLLTDREREVLALVGHGLSNDETPDVSSLVRRPQRPM